MTTTQRTLTWNLFLEEILPSTLRTAGVDEASTARVVVDVTRRARDYAASGRAARRALRAPFFEDVCAFQPTAAPPAVKADTAVVLRNSVLEDLHAASVVANATLVELTVLATGALNVWSAAHSRDDELAPPAGEFATVAARPRAYAALTALALAYETGGRRSFAQHEGPVPELTVAVQDSGRLSENDRAQVRSALSAPDAQLRALLEGVAAQPDCVLFVSSLSRFSRDSTTLAETLEFVLAHGGTVLTTNSLIRPGEVFVRRGQLCPANSYDPLSALHPHGLAGVHGKIVNSVRADLAG